MLTILVDRLDPAAITLGIFVRVLVMTEAQGVGPQLPPGQATERPAAHREVPWEVGGVAQITLGSITADDQPPADARAGRSTEWRRCPLGTILGSDA